MTTIQDRIIKDFRDKWTKAPDYHDPNTHQNYPAKYTERMSSLGFFVNMDEVEQFIIQSIKEVEEETRKEDTKFMAWCECGDALECKTVPNEKGFMVNHEYYCFGCDETYVLVKKSITNKEIKK